MGPATYGVPGPAGGPEPRDRPLAGDGAAGDAGHATPASLVGKPPLRAWLRPSPGAKSGRRPFLLLPGSPGALRMRGPYCARGYESIVPISLRNSLSVSGLQRARSKDSGPVLLLPNHVSWLDWLFLFVCLEEDWRFVTSLTSAEASWLHRRIIINHRTFPIDTTSPYAVKRMAEYLKTGGRLVLFPEGRLSRTGTLMKLFDGTGFLLFKTQAKVITCFVRGASRLPFSPHSGWKKLFPEVTCHFSEVLTPPKLKHTSTTQARLQLTNWLRDLLVSQQFEVEMEFGPQNLVAAIVEPAHQHPHQIVLEDATRQALSYRRLLVASDLLGQRWQRLLTASEDRVGICFPMSMPLRSCF